MRKLTVLIPALFMLAVGAGQAAADKVVVKGAHICCGQCAKIITGVLKDVDGVSDIKVEVKTKVVFFNTKDEKATTAAMKAIMDNGFFGQCHANGKDVEVAVAKAEGKAKTVVVEKVHVCCGQCEKAIKTIFQNATVTFEEKGPRRTVRIEGSTDLERAMVLEALHKAGFNGTLAK